MAFSFYSSLKSIPRELREAADIYHFSSWQRFIEMELPSGAIGLVWNSIVSVASGWFFLMACEMFVLGKHDFRLPGLGSYLQTAASAGDTAGILWGLTAMIRGRRDYRPVTVASADRLERPLQVRAGGSRRPRALAHSLRAGPLGGFALGGASRRAAGVGGASRPKSRREARDGPRHRAG